MKKTAAKISFVLTVAAAMGARAQTTVTWDGATGNWFDSVHWGLASGYPNNSGSSTYDVVVPAGSVWLDADMGVDHATFGGTSGIIPELAGLHSLTIASGMTLSSVVDVGIGVVLGPGSSSTITSYLSFTKNGTLTNNGTLTLGNGRIADPSLYATAAFFNNGLILSNGGSYIDSMNFVNKGTIDIQSGSLAVYGHPGFPQGATGNIIIEAGASYVAADNDQENSITGAGDLYLSWALQVVSRFDVQGQITINTGTLTLPSSVPQLNGTLQLYRDGALVFPGSLSDAGTVNFSGTISGGGTFTALKGYSVGSGATLSSNSKFVGKGTGTFGGSLRLGFGSTFDNEGTLTLGNGLITGLANLNGTLPISHFVNNGTLIVSGTPTFSDPTVATPRLSFKNHGLLRISFGTLQLNVPDDGSDGTFDIENVSPFISTLEIGVPATFAFGSVGGPVLKGNGVLIIDAGAHSSAAVDSPFTGSLVANGSFTLTASPTSSPVMLKPSSVSGTGTIILNADMTFSSAYATTGTTVIGGSVLFAGSTPPALGALKINAGGTATFSAHTSSVTSSFSNSGTLNVQSGSLTINSSAASVIGGKILVGSGALLTLTRPTSAVADTPTALQISGTLNLSDNLTVAATTTFFDQGVFHLKGGKLVLAAAQDSRTVGSFIIDAGATLQLDASYDFSTSLSPTLTGSGTVIVDAGAELILSIDSAFSGTIEVAGTLVLAAPRTAGAGPDIVPQFSIAAAAPSPEPASVAVLALAGPLLLQGGSPRRRPAP